MEAARIEGQFFSTVSQYFLSSYVFNKFETIAFGLSKHHLLYDFSLDVVHFGAQTKE